MGRSRGRADLTVERILDAAGAVFLERGIAGTGMEDIARAAQCSRATLYRAFENRRALRVAYVNREALRVAATVGRSTRGVRDPADRLAGAILAAVDEVRRSPTLAAWFTPEDMSIASELSSSSEVIDALAVGLLGDPGDSTAARWVVRVIVSLLTAPEPDPDAERRLVERFVVPPLLAARAGRS